MSNYSKTTDFEAKDSLPTGDSGKIIRGAEFETEFDAISTAIATKADTAGPTFTGTLTFETISDGTISVTAFVDEDDMSSDSATLVPTQQSVKAYVDSQVTAQDLDFQADSGGALSIDLDSETLTFTGGTGIDTSGSGNAVTFAIDSTVSTLTGTQTLTNKTLTSPDVNTPDIDGGTIDGTVIGGATPAAVSATTVSATGNITVGGTVDGRDVATDGSKLDGIESGATADQTAAEIRTLVDSASDSNVFTDADHSKLDNIEAGATGDQTNAEIRAAVEAATDSNVFTDADHSKLDGIEASADVTDTANVTAAGALMDSELTSEASVKALNQGVATTDSPTFAGVTVNGTVEFDGLSGTGSVTVTDILDQDDMSGNSATALATQQSIKAYVDSQVATADTLAEVLGNGNTTGGTDIAVGTGDDITFADSSKAIFGAGSDLQIYHDSGTGDSIIAESGTGSFFIRGANTFLQNAAGTNTYLKGVDGGAVDIRYGGAVKLATTSTGIDVTGTVTSTSYGSQLATTLFEQNVLKSSVTASSGAFVRMAVSSASNPTYAFEDDTDTGVFTSGANTLNFGTAGTERMRIDSDGNLGISTSSPATGTHSSYRNLVIGETTSATSGLSFKASTTGQSAIFFSDGASPFNRGQVLYDHSSDHLAFASAGTERMRIDSSGNVLVKAGNELRVNRADDATYGAISHGAAGTGIVYNDSNSDGHHWQFAGTEKARIDSSGNLLVGGSSAYAQGATTIANGGILYVSRSGGGPATFRRNSSDGSIITLEKDGTTVGSIGTGGGDLNIGTGDTRIRFNDATDNLIPLNASNGYRDGFISLGDSGARFKDLYLSGIIYGVQQTLTRDSGAPLELNRTTNDGELVYFKQAGIVRGSISISGSTTSYNTTSDYRLKENVVSMTGATERLKQLNPSRFNFIGDTDTTVDGFLAHEVADVVPEAITGAKDAVDDEGNAVYQGIDQSKLVPLLVATIQELEARIAALESN